MFEFCVFCLSMFWVIAFLLGFILNVISNTLKTLAEKGFYMVGNITLILFVAELIVMIFLYLIQIICGFYWSELFLFTIVAMFAFLLAKIAIAVFPLLFELIGCVLSIVSLGFSLIQRAFDFAIQKAFSLMTKCLKIEAGAGNE